MKRTGANVLVLQVASTDDAGDGETAGRPFGGEGSSDARGVGVDGVQAALLEEVTVTGSNLRGVPPTSPLVVMDRDELERTGQTTIADALRALPSNFGGGAGESFGVGADKLTPAQAALYQKAVTELAEGLEAADGIQRRGLVLAFIMRFKQICNHPSQWSGDGGYAPEASGKFQRLRELVEEIAERQEKALVFTQFREITDPLAAFLAELFGRPGLVLHGGTPVAQRRKLVESFHRDDGPPFFLLTVKAGGAGLNLTQAAHVIHFDRWWNPAVENQATDRAFRIGQKRNVLVHKFVCRGTIEERIDRLIESKQSLSRELLEGGGETLLTEMSNEELLRFVALDLNRATEA